MRAMAGVVPRGSFERAGRASGQLRPREAVKNRWFGNFIPDDLTETGRALDALAAAVEKPEFRGQLDTALNVLRVAGRIEADTLSNLGARIPEKNRQAVQDALSRYAADVAGEVIGATTGERMSPTTRQATQDLVAGMMDLTRLVRGTAGEQARTRDLKLAAVVRKITSDLATASGDLREGARRVAADGTMEAVNWRRLTSRMAVHNRRLSRTLAVQVDMSAKARAAAAALGKDVELTGRFALGIGRIIGAGSNKQMPVAERAQVVKEAAESMGPIFIKMVQTIINQSGGLQAFGLGDSPDHAVVLMALAELQDNVTPMPRRELEHQVRASLGKDIGSAFAEFDMTPIRSASIAQVHKAKVWVRRGPLFRRRLVEVAVKVQRPGLKDDLQDAVRASRLAMAVVRESLRSFDFKGKVDIDLEMIGRGLDLADNSIADFIRSFEIETDFKAERKTMKRFARLVRTEPDIYVPKVFDRQSGSGVITMEFIRGDKLSDPKLFIPEVSGLLAGRDPNDAVDPNQFRTDYMKRLERAQAARDAGAAASGPLPDQPGAAEAEARTRAADHAVRTWGLAPAEIQVTAAKNAFEVVARFDSESQPVARFRIGRDGRIKNRSTVPDLSRAGVTAMRDRLLGSFINHIIVNRFVHGDIHRGNFKILNDGKTIVLLDFGQVVKLSVRHFMAPARFGVGFWRKDTGRMAGAVVEMSDQYARLSRGERKTAAQQVKSALDQSMASSGGTMSPELVSEALVSASAKAGLTLSSVYLQWMKTSFAMWGNVSEATARSEPIGRRTITRTAGRMIKSIARKPMPISTAMGILKRRRVERLLRESAGP
jgi:predicted unusual protein kinase regulating ubiquinone biosynthesis (AarF/ABC1/UbiB family)